MNENKVADAAVSPAAFIARSETIAKSFVFFIALTSGLGGLMFGFDISIITGAGPFIEKTFSLNHLELGFAFSSLLFGCVVGSGIAGFLADKLGRRQLMLWVAMLFAATTVSTGMATSFADFNIARFLGGISVGAISLVTPLYIAEVAPASVRGRMGALYQFSIVFGVFVSFIINYALKDWGPDAWRYMFYTGAVPAAIFFTLVLFVPETPRFHALNSRWDQALATLKRVVDSRSAEIELAQIRASLDIPKVSLADFMAVGVRRPLIISFFLAIFVHLEGQNTVLEYAPSILQSAGFTLSDALLSTMVIGFAMVVFTVISFWVIDRAGRRPLYIVGSLGMAASFGALVAADLTGHFDGWLALAIIITYLMFFCACIGPVFWTLVPEIFPNHVRSQAMAVPVLVQWATDALVVLLFPVVFHGLGRAQTFGLLAFFCLLQGLFAWRYVPETKGRTLEEIAEHWKA